MSRLKNVWNMQDAFAELMKLDCAIGSRPLRQGIFFTAYMSGDSLAGTRQELHISQMTISEIEVKHSEL